MPTDIIYYSYIDSPMGSVLVARDDVGITRISFQEGTTAVRPDPAWHLDEEPLAEAREQLQAYFAGVLQTFDLPLSLKGTPFQRDVWKALQAIPYGETTTYGELARRIGRPKAVRAVGAANGQNPIPIVVPCHRVIGSNGTLTGYAGGVQLKKALLILERTHSKTPLFA